MKSFHLTVKKLLIVLFHCVEFFFFSGSSPQRMDYNQQNKKKCKVVMQYDNITLRNTFWGSTRSYTLFNCSYRWILIPLQFFFLFCYVVSFCILLALSVSCHPPQCYCQIKEIAVISHGVNETKVCSSIFLSFLILVCHKKSAFLRTNFPSIWTLKVESRLLELS